MIKEDNIDIDSTEIFLSGVPIFLDLDSEVIENMAKRMSVLRYAKGEYLIVKDKPGEYLQLIKNGKVFVELEDRNIFLTKGDIIGEMALISGRNSKANVIAEEPTETFVLYREDLKELMSNFSQLAATISTLMKSRISDVSDIQTLGKYQIKGQLGEGGMAVVYNAYDPDLEREVAIKMLKYEVATGEDFKKRFRQEAKTIARLKHPNILHVIETIEDYSTDFIVMEKLEGRDLSDYIKTEGSFSSEDTCEILYQVALALRHAHTAVTGGIIHRDVKPSNIFLDDNGHVVLTDFGIAVTQEDDAASSEGTVLYMAPEIFQEKPIDYRVDIYALGITVYAMLTGRTPFRASTMDEVIEMHISSEPPAIENFVPDIPTGLAEFVRRALIKDPHDRISEWDEILKLLESGKKSDIKLGLSNDKDMAIVIKIKSDGMVPAELLSELEKTIESQGVEYDIETVLKESLEVDIKFD